MTCSAKDRGPQIADVLSAARPVIQKRLSYDLKDLRDMPAATSS